jgi:hypothetical protein
MFCPKCRVEYREGFYECSDCHVPLVEVLRDESPAPEPGAQPEDPNLPVQL